MKKKGLLWGGIAIVVACLLFIGAAVWAIHDTNQGKDALAENTSQTTEEETSESILVDRLEEEETEPDEPEAQKIRLMMVGDNLMHMGIVYTGRMADGSYDYSFLFEPIEEYLAFADIKMINQETILGGNNKGFSGFPYFNSPTQVGDAIANAGFNVVLQASNHSADQGISGIKNCIHFWKTHPEVLMTGIYENANEENADIALLEVDGVTFAILNYTYGPNMGTLASDIQGHLGMLCNWNKGSGLIDFTTLHPDVLTDIQTADQMADVVIVCPHWGTEYQMTPSNYQKKFAKQMTEAGADLIIGTHPHTIEPVEWVESDNGNRALCYYSLGNYVSTQQDPVAMIEAMAWVTFVVEEDGVEILVEETGVIPMVCHYTANPVRLESVYFLDEYTQEQAETHGIHSFGGADFTLENLNHWSQEVFGDWALDSESVFKERIETEHWK